MIEFKVIDEKTIEYNNQRMSKKAFEELLLLTLEKLTGKYRRQFFNKYCNCD